MCDALSQKQLTDYENVLWFLRINYDKTIDYPRKRNRCNLKHN